MLRIVKEREAAKLAGANDLKTFRELVALGAMPCGVRVGPRTVLFDADKIEVARDKLALKLADANWRHGEMVKIAQRTRDEARRGKPTAVPSASRSNRSQ